MSEQFLTPFFSIIMPVYNSDLYLQKSIESILKQSFNNFELCIVNDGSIDQSEAILEQFADKDKRVKVKHLQSNQGVANARNEALNMVKGIYVTFIDADDYIDSNYLEVVYNTLNQSLENRPWHCLKLGAIEEYYSVEDSIVSIQRYTVPNQECFGKEDIFNAAVRLEQIPLFGYLWNTFYLHSILISSNCKFDMQHRVNEDFSYNVKIFQYIDNLKILDYAGYHYAKRQNNSLSASRKLDYYDQHCRKISEFLNIFNKEGLLQPASVQIVLWLYCRIVFSAIELNISEGERTTSSYCKEIFKSKLYNYFLTYDFKDLSLKQKILVKLLKSENSLMIYLFSALVGWVRQNLPIVFSKIKR